MPHIATQGAYSTGTTASSEMTRPMRDPVLDLIRVLALGLWLMAPVFGPDWMPLLFPAAGLALAVSGSLVADRLGEASPEYSTVLGRQLLRLLGPFWVFAAIVVPPLVWQAFRADGFASLRISDLWLWVVPVWTPPTLPRWQPWMPPLAYVSAFVVLMLVAAALRWLYRRWPLVTAVVLGILFVLQAGQVVHLPGELGRSVLVLTGLAPCFLAGYAHRLGKLRWMSRGLVLLTAALVAVGVVYALRVSTLEGPTARFSIVVLLLNLGTAVVALRLAQWPGVRRLASSIEGLTARVSLRSATLMVWGAAAVQAARWGVTHAFPAQTGVFRWSTVLVATLLGLVVVTLVLGWVEDLAAGRRPRIVPRVETRRVTPRRATGRPARAGFVLTAGVVAMATLLNIAGHTWSVNPIIKSEGTAACVATNRHRADLHDPNAKAIARMLISSAENSSLDWEAHYGYIEYDVEGNAKENRGYTAGLVGFTSKNGDMLQVVERYNRINPNNPLSPYLPALRTAVGSSSRDGLGRGFVSAWQNADTDERFRAAQREVADELYFNPAIAQAQADGVGVLGQFIYVDAAVMHGFGVASANSFEWIREPTLARAVPPAQGGDERVWLNAFLDARVAAMQAEQAHHDVSRINAMQRVFLDQGNLTLTPPLQWSVYGDEYEIVRATNIGCR